jgi:hypothetical protein
MYLVITLAGSGEVGHKDGIGMESKFRNPRGIIISKDRKSLFVSDNGNYCIRKVSLIDGRVSTVAGIPGITIMHPFIHLAHLKNKESQDIKMVRFLKRCFKVLELSQLKWTIT